MATAPHFAPTAPTWASLDRSDGPPVTFDPSTLDDLPAPARRLLAAALPPACDLHAVVRLRMVGEIRLGGRWLGFEARQILRAGIGFVWEPVVGGRLVRFVGADALGPDGGRLEFRFHGRIPVVRASGPDVTRSAAGRLAAETVAWLPQALTPQVGATWTAVDDERARVSLPGPAGPTEVTVAVDADGRLRDIGLQRWKDSADPPSLQPFGGAVTAPFASPDGVVVAGAGVVGWDWATPAQGAGRFFRYEVTAVDFGPSTPAP